MGTCMFDHDGVLATFDHLAGHLFRNHVVPFRNEMHGGSLDLGREESIVELGCVDEA